MCTFFNIFVSKCNFIRQIYENIPISTLYKNLEEIFINRSAFKTKLTYFFTIVIINKTKFLL